MHPVWVDFCVAWMRRNPETTVTILRQWPRLGFPAIILVLYHLFGWHSSMKRVSLNGGDRGGGGREDQSTFAKLTWLAEELLIYYCLFIICRRPKTHKCVFNKTHKVFIICRRNASFMCFYLNTYFFLCFVTSFSYYLALSDIESWKQSGAINNNHTQVPPVFSRFSFRSGLFCC